MLVACVLLMQSRMTRTVNISQRTMSNLIQEAWNTSLYQDRRDPRDPSRQSRPQPTHEREQC